MSKGSFVNDSDRYLVIFDFCSGCAQSMGAIYRRGRILTGTEIRTSFTEGYFLKLTTVQKPKLRKITVGDKVVDYVLNQAGIKSEAEAFVATAEGVDKAPKTLAGYQNAIGEKMTPVAHITESQTVYVPPMEPPKDVELLKEIQGEVEYPGPRPEDTEKGVQEMKIRQDIQERLPLIGDVKVAATIKGSEEEPELGKMSVRKLNIGNAPADSNAEPKTKKGGRPKGSVNKNKKK